ncbi:MAG: hypothetical protein AMJ78_10725 [Omnitrophica WOR_2 bacterium SM23_29]|nr:MAG: hypothetical protein AMJ78_10725 [Omnitrophica WOR_2 bacterium SM23_29]
MIFAYFCAFIFGSVVGSFLNVCIYRMPRGESIIYPWSHCTNCRRSIAWYDNIPFISYLILKGRCRYCMAKISFRYFIVEGLTATTFVLLLWRFNISLFYLIYAALISILIIISFIDLEHRIIPDELSLGGLILGLILSGLYPALHDKTSMILGLKNSLLGILVGGGSIYLIGLFGSAIFKKEAMGGGDVKLLAFIGAFLGWKLTLLTFFIAPILGSIVGVPLKLIKKQDTIPYGPFLSLATFISTFWGDKILNLILPI